MTVSLPSCPAADENGASVNRSLSEEAERAEGKVLCPLYLTLGKVGNGMGEVDRELLGVLSFKESSPCTCTVPMWDSTGTMMMNTEVV